MPTIDTFRRLDLSRRRLLSGAILASAGATLAVAGLAARPAAAAPKKLSQSVAAYQGSPKGKQRCDNCVQWQPPAACKIVDGDIAPSGWCNLYAAKG